MAELEGGTAIVQGSTLHEHEIVVREYDEAGRTVLLKCELPTSLTFEEWSVIQQVVMLKRGLWKKCSLPDIVWGLAYARRIGADPMKGDLFPTGEGRWGTSNEYKIRKALDSGNIVGIEFELEDTGDRLPESIASKCVQKTDLVGTAIVYVKGWQKPIVRKQRLSRWFKPGGKWEDQPENMLELNAKGHACKFVPGAGLGGEVEGAPPMDDALSITGMVKP